MHRDRFWAHRAAAITLLGSGSMLLHGCPLRGLLDDCFGEGTISRSEYEDMYVLERLLYEENSCGRYDPRFDFDD